MQLLISAPRPNQIPERFLLGPTSTLPTPPTNQHHVGLHQTRIHLFNKRTQRETPRPAATTPPPPPTAAAAATCRHPSKPNLPTPLAGTARAVEPQDHLRPTPEPHAQCGSQPRSLWVHLRGDGELCAAESDGDSRPGEKVSLSLYIVSHFKQQLN